MPNIVLENISSELAARIAIQANQHGRTVVAELVDVLNRAIDPMPVMQLPANPFPTLKPITTEMVLEAIREGRDCLSWITVS